MTYDAYDEAMQPVVDPSSSKAYFGQVVLVDAYACILQKGAGKVLFDANRHHADQKRIAIKLSVECRKRDGGTYTIDQDSINTGKEWREITQPSLLKLGQSLRTLNGQYVQVKRVPTGETYISKPKIGPDGATIPGELREKTALSFVAIYASADEAATAERAFYTPRSERTGETAAPAPSAPQAPAQPAVAPADDEARKQAASFLPMLWQMAAGDPSKFYKDLAANPVLSQYFDYESPEVEAITGGVPF